MLRALDVERVIGRERCRERDLVVAMIVQRVIGPGSKLSATRRFGVSTLADELDLGEVKEAELLSAMDWLLERQERIEKTLAHRHLSPDGSVLYDLSSSYVEGRCCPLAKLGYSRDGRKGTQQVNYGLICSPEGRPVAVHAFDGSTTDSKTLPDAVQAVTERFGVKNVVLVGDRGMITQAHAQTLKENGVGFISALKSAQIRTLINAGAIQLSLFDESNLAEISSEKFDGERLIVCRNPAVAAERARKRQELLAATEAELQKVKRMVDGPRGSLRKAHAGQIGTRAGKIVNKYKVSKHFELHIADGAFSFARKHQQIEEETALDGLYVIRTTCPAEQLSSPSQAAVRAYKQLKMAEASIQDDEGHPGDPSHPPPPRETRVRAHIFPCNACARLLRHLRARRTPDHHALHRPGRHSRPRTPLCRVWQRRSKAAKTKAASAATEDGHPASNLPDLLAELGTIARNTIRIGEAKNTFTRLTKPTPLQAKALDLLNVKLAA